MPEFAMMYVLSVVWGKWFLTLFAAGRVFVVWSSDARGVSEELHSAQSFQMSAVLKTTWGYDEAVCRVAAADFGATHASSVSGKGRVVFLICFNRERI